MRRAPDLVVIAPTPAAWAAYDRWRAARGEAPQRASDAVFVAEYRVSEVVPIAAVLLYPTDGPWALAEHGATDPAAPLRVRHAAVVAIGRALRVYAATRAKTVVLVTRHRGIARCLMRAGVRVAPGTPMQVAAWAWV